MYRGISKEFNPSVLNPAYFIRHCILNGIKRNENFMNGLMMDFGSGAKPYQSLLRLINISESITKVKPIAMVGSK